LSPLRLEIRKLTSLALPVAATQVSTMLMGFVDTLMVGRVSVEALAAVSLANTWIFGTMMLANGVVFGLDPIVAQAHGARDGRRAGRALQHGVVLALLLSVPVCGLLLVTDRVLIAFGQDPALAADALRYAVVQVPSVPFFLVYGALRQYLQGRELMRPAMYVILIANVFNAGFNWVLIFGHLGFPALGLVGAGIATTLTRVLSCVGLIAFVRAFRLHRGAWVPWSRDALRVGGLLEVFRYGWPVAIMMALEMWAFGAAQLLAGRLGAVAIASHAIALNMAALAFMVPVGISQGASTRVGNLIGARRPLDAQRAAWVALGLGAGVMTVSAFAFVVFRETLPRIYTPEASVIALCASVLPIAGAFQIFDGAQVVACGALRGMGRVRPAMVFNLLSYWALGLPLGGWLALWQGWGLAGIWWGLCIGLATVSLLLVGWIALRGPARDPQARLTRLDRLTRELPENP
jgi:MATE family multidrug resistance protein